MWLRTSVRMSGAVVGGVSLTTPVAGAQQLSLCDGAAGSSVAATDSHKQAEAPMDLARQGAAGLGEERLGGALPGAEGLRQRFLQADADGDGRISREEWLRSFGPAHAAAPGQPTGPN